MQGTLYQTADAGDTADTEVPQRIQKYLYQTEEAGVSLSDSGCRICLSDSGCRSLSIRQLMQETF